MLNCSESWIIILSTKVFSLFYSLIFNLFYKFYKSARNNVFLENKKFKWFKTQFRSLSFYSLPPSIEIVFRKRINFVWLMVSFFMFVAYSFVF
jgi:hypothetical protein